MDQALAVPYSGKSWDQECMSLILAAFLYMRPFGGVLQAVGPNKQIRTQQSIASGAGKLLRYDCFCGPQESLGVIGAPLRVRGACPGAFRDVLGGSQGHALGSQGRPRGSQGRARGIHGIPDGSRDFPGIHGIFLIEMIL